MLKAYFLVFIWFCSGIYASDFSKAELGITSASEEATRRVFAARDAFLLKDFEAAIRHMNQVDLDSFYSERVLIETFNPRFFEEISLPFVRYLSDKNIGEELLGQSWFRALAMIPSVIQAFESLSQESDAGKEKFHATRQRITCFAKCKQVAHAYASSPSTSASSYHHHWHDQNVPQHNHS